MGGKRKGFLLVRETSKGGGVAMSADTCGCHKLAGRGVGAALLGSGGRDQGCSKHSTMHRTAPFSPSEELPTAGLPCGSSG